VGIDLSQYGHDAAFLTPEIRTASPGLKVLESAARHALLCNSARRERNRMESGGLAALL